jgi:hypothetical protein
MLINTGHDPLVQHNVVEHMREQHIKLGVPDEYMDVSNNSD